MGTDFIVNYTKQVYSYRDIVKAVNDYLDICTISVSETPEDYVCRFQFPNGVDPIIILEFSNYLIELNCADR